MQTPENLSIDEVHEIISLAEKFGLGVLELILLVGLFYFFRHYAKIIRFFDLLTANLSARKTEYESKIYLKAHNTHFREYAIFHDLLKYQPIRIVVYKYVKLKNESYEVNIIDEMPNVGCNYISEKWSKIKLGEQGKKILSTITEKGTYYNTNIDDMPEGETKHNLILNNVKSVYSALLHKDKELKSIIVLSISFNRDNPLELEDLTEISNQINNLKNLLFYKDSQIYS